MLLERIQCFPETELYPHTLLCFSCPLWTNSSSKHSCLQKSEGSTDVFGGPVLTLWWEIWPKEWLCKKRKEEHHFCCWQHLLLLLFSRDWRVMSNSLQPHGLQNVRLPWPPVSPWICSDSCPLSCWRYLTISCSAGPFSSCLQSFPASDSFPVSHLFASGGQNIGTLASTSVLAVTIQGWFPFRLTGLISLLSKGLSGVFSSTIIWNNQFFSTQPLCGPTLTSIRD